MIRRIICFFFGHRLRELGRIEDETDYSRCERCGQSWSHYF